MCHGESEWNQKNLFTGWVDVELSSNGIAEAHNAGKALLKAGFDFDVCFTSYLKRAINTQQIILQEMDREWLPVFKSYKLNERHYGALQGLNKAETAAKYGEEQVHIWRRSFDVRPPEMQEDNSYNARKQAQYRDIPQTEIPMHGKIYWDPRINIGWTFPKFSIGSQTVFFELAGGIGEHTKTPTISQIYPDPYYLDLAELNYYHSNSKYRRIYLMTYVINPTNYNLHPARNKKWEIRGDLNIGGNRLSVTYFQENML